MTATGCATPLTAVDLSMFLDGDADATVIAHLRHCADCQRRAQRLQQEQQRWQTLFHRHSCPPAQELCDYVWELLPAADQQRVAQHLTYCPHCTHELLNNYVTPAQATSNPASQPAGSAWWATGIDQLRILVSHITQPPTPAYAGALRGSDQAQALFYQLEETTTLLATIAADPNHSGNYWLEIRVVGLTVADVAVQLWQEQHLLQSVQLDAAGDAIFENLAAGHYELILSAPQLKIHIPHLAIAADWPDAVQSPFADWE